jgi:hypothetical protein
MASRFLTEADKNELAKRIPTKTSQLTNDSGYVTDDAIPTKTSQLTNDSKYQNESQVKASIAEALKDIDVNVDVDLDDYALKEDVPTKTSQLTNDSKFQNEDQVKDSIDEALKDVKVDVNLDDYALKEDIPTKTSQLTNDSGFLTQHQDLSDYALKENIPTKTSQLTNDTFGGTVEITSGNPEKENTVLTLDPSSESVNIYTAEETDAKLEQLSREFNERLNSIQNGNGVAY